MKPKPPSPLKRELQHDPTSTDVSVLRRIADSFPERTRECLKRNKPLDQCDTCRSIVAWFAKLSLPMLSAVIEDRPITRAQFVKGPSHATS